MPLVLTLAAVVAGYAIGSIPAGILVCKAVGKDPRTTGSGRTGGSNVYRTAGLVPAAITVVGDVLKGTAAVLLAGRLLPQGAAHGWAMALAALAAILGHNYSMFIGFKGGAGSSPNMGALLAYSPLFFLGSILISGSVWVGTKIASVASLVLSVLVLVSVTWLVSHGQLPTQTLFYGAVQLCLIAWALRPNIQRLLQGRELKVEHAEPPDLPQDPA